MNSNEVLPTVKVVLLGEAGVGKTSIIHRYTKDTFANNCSSTTGSSFVSKRLNVNNTDLQLDIWDTAGQEKYRALTKYFYKDADIAILVYDIVNKESFDSLKNYWVNQIRENGDKDIIIGVAGNKSDSYMNEDVSEEEAERFANEINSFFVLTSAKSNTGIKELFIMAGEKYLEKKKGKNLEKETQNDSIRLDNKKVKKKGKCC